MITTLKEAVHRVIDNSPIPTRQLAEEIGISYSYLMNSANPDLRDFKLAARVLIPLTRLTGDFSAINFIEHSLGRQAVELPVGKPAATTKDIHSELFNAVGIFGDLVNKSTAALAGSRVTAADATEIERQGYQVITGVLKFLRAVETCRKERAGYVG